MTSGQHIDYDALALEALRGVVKACLAQVSRTGLVGEHHFYIAFNTQVPGVGMSKRLKEKYPVEMTIVLQHRFRDLVVDDDRFEVKLTFDGIPERLVVPFAAVKVFYDPSVPYVLQFEEIDPAAVATPPRKGPRRVGGSSGPVSTREPELALEAPDSVGERPDRRKPPRKSRTEQAGDAATAIDSTSPEGDEQEGSRPPVAPPAATPAPVAGGKPTIAAVRKADGSSGDEAPGTDENAAASDSGGAKIFDLSKFRGKK